MADFAQNLFKGSFRGVSFDTKDYSFNTGRKLVVHQYPTKDTAYSEDMGRKQGEHELNVYVVGPSWITERDALIRACQEEGPGTLVHPYFGERFVNCDSCYVTEVDNAGCIAYLSLKFLEQGEGSSPFRVLNTQADIDLFGIKLNFATARHFARTYKTKGLSGVLDEAAKQIGTNFANQLIEELGLNPFIETATEVYDIIQILKSDPESDDADAYSEQFLDIYSRIDTDLDDPSKKKNIFSSMSGFTDEAQPIKANTPTRVKQDENSKAMTHMIGNYALTHYGKAVGEYNFKSYEEATAIKKETKLIFDRAIEESSNLGAWEASGPLRDMKAAVIKHIDQQAPSLARTKYIRVIRPTPAICIAYDQYNDLDAEASVINRNNVTHPLYVTGERIEVLVK